MKWTIVWPVEHCDTEHCYLPDDSNRLENDPGGTYHVHRASRRSRVSDCYRVGFCNDLADSTLA